MPTEPTQTVFKPSEELSCPPVGEPSTSVTDAEDPITDRFGTFVFGVELLKVTTLLLAGPEVQPDKVPVFVQPPGTPGPDEPSERFWKKDANVLPVTPEFSPQLNCSPPTVTLLLVPFPKLVKVTVPVSVTPDVNCVAGDAQTASAAVVPSAAITPNERTVRLSG